MMEVWLGPFLGGREAKSLHKKELRGGLGVGGCSSIREILGAPPADFRPW